MDTGWDGMGQPGIGHLTFWWRRNGFAAGAAAQRLCWWWCSCCQPAADYSSRLLLGRAAAETVPAGARPAAATARERERRKASQAHGHGHGAAAADLAPLGTICRLAGARTGGLKEHLKPGKSEMREVCVYM